jgi:hypothetical protein
MQYGNSTWTCKVSRMQVDWDIKIKEKNVSKIIKKFNCFSYHINQKDIVMFVGKSTKKL